VPELGELFTHFEQSLAIAICEPIGSDGGCGGLEKSTQFEEVA
jgi:hypothetical protein